jgi:predicted naringenin-chalcone synthase
VLGGESNHDDKSKGVPTTADRMMAYREFAAPLAIEAATQAIEQSELAATSLTHLITVSCSGFAAPGVDFALIHALGLSPEIQRTHVGFMGCHASLNAIRVARAICESNHNARVLVCAVELCTIHQQYTDDPQQLVANSLFGDGAAAIVMQSNVREFYHPTDHLHHLSSVWSVIDNASIVLENTADMMSWHVGDFGFQMGLSPKVPEISVERLSPWLAGWLSKHNLAVSEIANWLVHPGGPRILSAVQESLQLDENALSTSWQVLRRCGNMSSPTVLFILEEHSNVALPGPSVMLGFGPGLVTEACLLHRS